MRWDVTGIGNALMDALVVLPDDALLEELGLIRGTMHPVDHDRWQEIYERIREHDVVFHSGGSCANTIATVGRLRGRAIYRGQVGDDQLGRLYGGLLEKSCGGHALRFAPGLPTGKCLSIISERDAERTMLTDLGAAVSLPDLGDFADALQQTKIAHFTGYTLLDGPMRPVVLEAMRVAGQAGARVSLDAADPFVVHGIRDVLIDTLREHTQIVFLNAEEARALTQLEEPEASCRFLANELGIRTAVVKLGARGSVVLDQGTLYQVPVYPVEARDSTGAGDAYAGGFLHGLSQGWPIERCGRLASAVAGLVVAQIGAVIQDLDALHDVLGEAA
ncbi:MAG TPA: adenosine kinase [Deltaproteobacteria bacterium]|nr:adenosine kinase [Deltaproteobacteria bacterium]